LTSGLLSVLRAVVLVHGNIVVVSSICRVRVLAAIVLGVLGRVVCSAARAADASRGRAVGRTGVIVISVAIGAASMGGAALITISSTVMTTMTTIAASVATTVAAMASVMARGSRFELLVLLLDI
jgi:hypothetical protein